MICHVTLRTSKLKETVKFYDWLLELPVSRTLETPDGVIIFLGENETKFELIEDNNAGKIDAKGLTIGFTVDNLDGKLVMLDSRQIPHSQVISPSPNTRFAFFTDINGCGIQLLEQKQA